MSIVRSQPVACGAQWASAFCPPAHNGPVEKRGFRRALPTVRGLRARLLASSLALLTACGGGSGMNSSSMSPGTGSMPAPMPSSCSASTCGAALLTMTDAKGDFLSYIVTLTSLQLQTANGASVETLPTATKV